ncbi:MAG TPA: AraC family transcriptional regulator [Lachnospiraceae bacterium]|nr:AraC family transcriptional regulator [Lachnospiraceae bacterium]
MEITDNNPEEYVVFKKTNHILEHYEYHFHDVYEIYYFISGDANYLVEGKEYHLTPNSLILLSPYVLHSVKVNSTADYVRCCLFFRPEDIILERRSFLLSCFPGQSKYTDQREIFFEHTEVYNLEVYFRNFTRLNDLSGENKIQYHPIFLEALLSQIHFMSQTIHQSKVTNDTSTKIADMIHYLNEHMTEDISLDDLARRFYLSKYYITRAFKKITGTTIMNYLTHKRIILARQFMLNGDTASEASNKVGFSDYSAFFRAYKKILGHSPSMEKNQYANGVSRE